MEWIIWIGAMLLIGALKFGFYYARVRWAARKWR